MNASVYTSLNREDSDCLADFVKIRVGIKSEVHMKRVILFLMIFCSTLVAAPSDPMLVVRDAPESGIVVTEIDPVRILPPGITNPDLISVSASVQGQDVPVQIVPPMDKGENGAAILILHLPKGGDHRVTLKVQSGKERSKVLAGPVHTQWLSVTHDPAKLGGLPSRIEFLKTGKVITGENFSWQDRLHHRQLGGFTLKSEPAAKVELVSEGSICSVVRVSGGYWKGKDQPDSKPTAVYDWFYFHDQPLVFVQAMACQKNDFAWNEIHFLEMNFRDESFKQWAGGDPVEQGAFVSTNKSSSFSGWGALIDGQNAVAILRGGRALLYDGKGQRYLQADGDAAWKGWKEQNRRMSAWLWMASDSDPVAAVRRSVEQLPGSKVVLTSVKARSSIDALLASVAGDDSVAGRQKRWCAAMAENMEANGRLDEIPAWLENKPPAAWTTLTSGELAVSLEKTEGGLACRSLFDLKAGRELLSPHSPPLFDITLRRLSDSNEVHLVSDTGWNQVAASSGGIWGKGRGLEICWRKSTVAGLSDLCVEALLVNRAPKAPADGIAWHLSVSKVPRDYTLLKVAFPQVAVADFSPDLAVFFPRGPGEVKKGIAKRGFHYGGTYPNGWTTMQFLSAYDEKLRTGLYFAMHDGEAHTKDMALEGRIQKSDVFMSFSCPVPDMGLPGNRFTLPAPAVWQLLRGDWYDAAKIYRDWAAGGPGRAPGAKWWPKLTDDGRKDTPMWMRELPAWAISGGESKACVPNVKKFQQYLNLPSGVHWYNWHKIPFDNDYPHYFPYKDGFVEGVKDLQAAGVYVMPYINGRLWDTHDRGAEDFEFTSLAKPYASKDQDGKVITESYSSKEADSNKVVLAAMCPCTKFWQKQVKDIVIRLMTECETRGVYIDQIAAAKPTLCCDKSHGHPLGGGNWWWQGYVKMLSDLRKGMPEHCMITTECNAEPYLRWMDGYLTWHWQHDGQVPAFPAVYGGTVQMFGRAYGGGPTRDLAARMKAGQQLVFGEQVGWCGPDIVNHKESADFFRQAVQLRWLLRRYFYTGQMMRPPRLIGEMPTVQADWQWHGVWPVTTDAVLTGAWRQEKNNRLVLIFANVSDKPVSGELTLDLHDWGLQDGNGMFRVTVIDAQEAGEKTVSPVLLERKITFEPKKVLAIEIEH
ncbi:MAG: hypothetical protein A2283_08235 [Lentisphaerae bacterium RIFOXYA12_FULL_48_11]|nr:MAG: hypothetical protein A2283_08235 [Lentisphaerae bacterium RIFOXYA12_FULL_48_11]